MTKQKQRVFAALGDATRRELIEILSIRGDKTATDLASMLTITRQAISKHLGILADAGLVQKRREGRETIYSFDPQSLGTTLEWVQSVSRAWDKRLHVLKDLLENDDSL